MKKYEILQDFSGAQDGRFAENFKAGTTVELSDWLAAGAPPGAIRLVGQIKNKAIVTDGAQTGALTKREK